MAFDPTKHVLDPETGFIVDKDTGHHVGVHQTPDLPVAEGKSYPKWVAPHESHLVRRDNLPPIAPAYPDIHVARDGTVTVLVHDAADEREARAMKKKPAQKSDDE